MKKKTHSKVTECKKKCYRIERLKLCLELCWGGIFTDNRQDRSGVRGRGKLKGHTSSTPWGQNNGKRLTRKRLCPPGYSASMFPCLIDIPFAPWKILRYWTWTYCLSLYGLCSTLWKLSYFISVMGSHVLLPKQASLHSGVLCKVTDNKHDCF